EGAFFAIKEVSLLDQGSNAQQSILALEQEIALLSQIEHENIVQYYGTDKEESKLYIFIELVTQGPLSSLYQKYKLQDSQVSAYTRQILNGLVYLHERNVVHRDIKCANILVHANGSVKLADFGLAKEMSKINMLRSCKGSVYWMAPEVVNANPKKTYGPQADIWSLGCTVLEMLTRQIPYPNVEWTNAFFMIGKGEKPHIPSYLSEQAQDFISQSREQIVVIPTQRQKGNGKRFADHPEKEIDALQKVTPSILSSEPYPDLKLPAASEDHSACRALEPEFSSRSETDVLQSEYLQVESEDRAENDREQGQRKGSGSVSRGVADGLTDN
ncbi:hypothetical protein GUJ93_ZPchr0003g17339, partial [Zizania palustris]